MHIEILKDLNTDSSVTVGPTSAQREWENQDQERSKTGDTISPKLFTETLRRIFRRLNCENKGVNIDGEFITNIRFADDIMLMHRNTTRTTTLCYENYPKKVGEWVLTRRQR